MKYSSLTSLLLLCMEISISTASNLTAIKKGIAGRQADNLAVLCINEMCFQYELLYFLKGKSFALRHSA